MSSRDKVEFLKRAQEKGFRTYLYYMATEDPDINVSRVENRVQEGGHPVPKDKIVTRYHRSLALLAEAVQYTNRAYIFDNSSHQKVWIAEVTEGNEMELKSDTVPYWFKAALWDKFSTPGESTP
jgi:predicted ABC-type ATPase